MNWWLPEFYNKIITECSKMSGQLLGPNSLQNLNIAKNEDVHKNKKNWTPTGPQPLVDTLHRKNVHFPQFIKYLNLLNFEKGGVGGINLIIFRENIQGVKIIKIIFKKNSNDKRFKKHFIIKS